MRKKIFLLVAGSALLSGCSISVDGGSWERYDHGQSSLTVRADNDAEMSVNCGKGREPYSTGGEKGAPLVMGCRNVGEDQNKYTHTQ